MFETILVPLDGSPTSDHILIELKRLLIREGVTVKLLRVVSPMHAASRSERDERDERRTALRLRVESARHHLTNLQESLEAEGVDVVSDVLLGDPASVIARRAASHPGCLVAMSTRGRSGPARWFLGSTAERVMRICPAPVLLVTSDAARARPPGVLFERVLVPLDGSKTAEQIVPLVEDLGGFYRCEAVLLSVTPVIPLGPGGAPAPLPHDPAANLAGPQQTLEAASIHVRTLTRTGDPAHAILEAAESEEVDLVAMCTHGHTGFDRWAFGSVAEKVLRHCNRPLLVLRVAARAALDEHEPGQTPEEAEASPP